MTKTLEQKMNELAIDYATNKGICHTHRDKPAWHYSDLDFKEGFRAAVETLSTIRCELPVPSYEWNSWGMSGSGYYPLWPDSITGCDEFNTNIHNALCENLEKREWDESDVCTASVGMWGAINVTRDYLVKHFAPQLAALKTENEELKEYKWKYEELCK
jgi:hypothetical protein